MDGARFKLVMVALVPVAMILAACGSSSTDTASGGTPSSAATGEDSSAQARDGLSTAEVSGVGTVLTNGDGFTLYYLKTDAHREVTCTGSCAQTWPPALVTDVPDAAGLPGQLGTIANPSGGTQLTYAGWRSTRTLLMPRLERRTVRGSEGCGSR
jgi:predicted lipoprotein with Yx(FWY)xxD motif